MESFTSTIAVESQADGQSMRHRSKLGQE